MGDKHDSVHDYPRGERTSKRQQMLQMQQQQQQQQARLLELQRQAIHDSQPAAKKARKETVQDTTALRNMLLNFRVSELQMLLGYAGRNKSGRKTDLQQRAVDLLRNCSEPVAMKIRELHESIQQQAFAEQNRLPTAHVPPMAHPQSHPHHLSRALSQNPISHTTHASQMHPNSSMYHTQQYTSQAQQQQQQQQQQQSRMYTHHAYQTSSARSLQPQPPVSSGVHKMGGAQMDMPNVYNNWPPKTFPVHPDVRLKKLPFYEIQAELLKPSSLVPQGSGPRLQEQTFVFHLSPQQATAIAQNRDCGPGSKNEYIIQVQMRFCLLETSCEQDDCFPPSILVKVNGKQCNLPNPIPTNRPGMEPKRPPRPINISPLVKLSPTVSNQILVQWNSDYTRGYCIAANLVRKLSSSELLAKMRAKGVRHSDFTRGLIKEKLNDADAEIATTSLRVSLMCPLGKMRMNTPCRASTCVHLQCFDASLYLQMNERKPTWICPVCDKECHYDNLLIDGYFQDVLQSGKLPSDSHEIQLHPDGSWTTLSIKKEPKRTASPVDKGDAVEIIDDLEIISADDSKTTSTTGSNSSNSSTKEAEKKKESIIVVTLDSDSEEDVPPPKSSATTNSTTKVAQASAVPSVITSLASSKATNHTSRAYQTETSSNNTTAAGPSSVSSSGYMSPTITLDDSPSPPSRPTPTLTPAQQPSAQVASSSPGTTPTSRSVLSHPYPSHPISSPYMTPPSVPCLDLEAELGSSYNFPYL